ncbi:MAG: AraC family transcriptional regulator [Gammaproteobacteria bacterium]|nr:AraC family transcriptional regulator [Gammaproteobacteria bacterium]MDH3507504.1 AraC family transcriptional regulator [Gammaproteobacteria bacterium]
MEVLSDILRAMRVAGSVYFCERLSAPWSQEFGDPAHASFHLVRKGECFLNSGATEEHLQAGDFIFVEAGRKHTLSDSARDGTRSTPQTILLCGYCSLDAPARHPLLEALRSLTIVRAEELERHAWLKSTLEQLSNEYETATPGSEVVVDRLTEVLLVELIRINFGRSETAGFIRALYDKPIAKTLALMHDKPEENWTLETLASEAAMSRSAYAARFKELVGQTMFEYLTAVRMQRAQGLLRESGLSLPKIAERVGYTSRLAFSKAFKRLTGTTPSRYRRQWRTT